MEVLIAEDDPGVSGRTNSAPNDPVAGTLAIQSEKVSQSLHAIQVLYSEKLQREKTSSLVTFVSVREGELVQRRRRFKRHYSG